MKIYKIARMPKEDKNERDIRSVEKDIKNIEKDTKDFKREVQRLKDSIKDLNVGNRLFFQQKSIFTSLQRKIERFEKMESEWKMFKQEILPDIKSIIKKEKKK